MLLLEAGPAGIALPLALRLVCVVGTALVGVLVSVRHGRRRAVSWASVLPLILLAALALPLLVRQPDSGSWPREAESRLRARFESTRSRVLGVEALLRRLGDQAYALLDSMGTAPAGPEERVRLFAALEGKLAAAQQHNPLGPRHPLSVRLFDQSGELRAWAGSLHASSSSRRLTHFPPGEIYFQSSGALTFMTYERRRDEGATPPGMRAVVETPVQTSFGPRQQRQTDWDLARGLSGNGVGVELHYDSPFVPPYLTQEDLEIHGDPTAGLQGDFVIRGHDTAPRLLGRLTTIPIGDESARRNATVRQAQAWLAVVLLLGALGGLQRNLRLRGGWRRPLVVAAALWAARGLLAWLELPTTGAHAGATFGPVAFAMKGLGGLLRSPFDLFLTALVLAATSALVFVRCVHAARSPVAARAVSGPWRLGAGALLACSVAGAAVHFALLAVERVARNSTLPLLGPQLDLSAWPVLCLHGALLAGIAALVLLAALLVSRLLPRGAAPWFVLLAAATLGAVVWWRAAPLPALCAVAVFLGGAYLYVLLADDRFTSFALALFALVALTATLGSEAVRRDALRARQELVLARADEVRRLVEETRPFVLEHVLADLAGATRLQHDLRFRDDVDSGALAFEIWAGSALASLSWPCQVRVYDETNRLASAFSSGLPYEQDTLDRDLLERARAQGTLLEQTEIQATPVGRVRLYRGAALVRLGAGQRRGLVVVDLPFAHESLALAANPRLRTPELLRPMGEAGTGPRVDESQLYLLAWLEKGFVVESSTPYLEVGELAAKHPAPGDWRRLRLVNGSYRVTEIPAGQRTLLAGFQLPKALDRLLDWTQVASLDFTAAVALLLLLVVFGRSVAAMRALPPLFVPKRVGFQQKLMGAFLVVALLPSVVLSLATRDIMRERSTSRNRDAALAKARSAEAALSDVVHREIQNLRDSEYLREVLKQETAPPVRDIGNLESSQIMVFHGDSSLILDETLSNLSDAEALRFVTDSPRQIFASRDEAGRLYLGLLEPLWFSPEMGMNEDPEARLYYLYYRRRLTDDLLRELAPILNTDISGFVGPHLVVSSQKSLAAAGLLPLLVPPEAFQHLLLRDNRYAVVEETAWTQRYFAGYLPLEDRFGQRLGALAVQQILQPDEFAVEVERTRALVVGLSTSMFVLTLILAVVFAARIFDPVRSLIEGTRRIAGGDLGFRLDARAGDEIGELERSFNDMAVRLQAARAALDERRRHLEAVLGNIASGVVAPDLQGRVTAANAAVARILGVQPSHLEGRSWQELQAQAVDPGSRGFWSHVGQGRDGESVELSLLRGHDRVTLRVIVTDLRPANLGESLGRVAIFEDLTELIRSKKLAAWAEMARQVAHEIKNPLTPLKLSAQFMEQAYRDRSDKFPDIFSEGMQTIVRQVDVLRRIASEFSSFGRMQKLVPKSLDLGGVLRHVTAPYRSMQDLVVDTGDAANGFPGDGVTVLGDEEGLRKVFSNILENAREAMGGSGRIELRVSTPGDGSVQVQVADGGAGLTDEARSRLFEPYFSTKTTGTGLGLAISRGILEELGGSITLSNRPHGGAEVRVTLTIC